MGRSEKKIRKKYQESPKGREEEIKTDTDDRAGDLGGVEAGEGRRTGHA